MKVNDMIDAHDAMQGGEPETQEFSYHQWYSDLMKTMYAIVYARGKQAVDMVAPPRTQPVVGEEHVMGDGSTYRVHTDGSWRKVGK